MDPDCASSGPEGIVALALRGKDFKAPAGALARAWVIDEVGAPIGVGEASVQGGAFTMDWPKLLPASDKGYTVRAFVDADADGVCGQGEHEFTVETGAVILPIELTITPTSPAPAACGAAPEGASLQLDGAGFAASNGSHVRARVTHPGSLSIVATGETTTKNGAFRMRWPSLLQPGLSYQVSYALDVEADGLCGQGDEVGTLLAKGGQGDVLLDAKPQPPPPPDACAAFTQGGFNLLVHGSGFDADEGAEVHLQLFRGDAATGLVRKATIDKGSFTIALEGALEGEGPFFIGYFLDKDKNDLCTPKTDPAWYQELGTPAKDVVVEVVPDAPQSASGCWTDG